MINNKNVVTGLQRLIPFKIIKGFHPAFWSGVKWGHFPFWKNEALLLHINENLSSQSNLIQKGKNDSCLKNADVIIKWQIRSVGNHILEEN